MPKSLNECQQLKRGSSLALKKSSRALLVNKGRATAPNRTIWPSDLPRFSQPVIAEDFSTLADSFRRVA